MMNPTTKKLITKLEATKTELDKHYRMLFVDENADPEEVECLGDLLRGLSKNLKKLKSP
jgi:hypothetical protein